MIERLVALALLFAPGLCWAQGNETATSSPSGSEESAARSAVQVGAGSTSAVTTGSSGPEGSQDETVSPIAPSFSMMPQKDTFLGPGMLAIQAPDRLRCDVIADDTMRERCSGRSIDNSTESAND